ncbi:class I SAM-dependent methyltransferase [Methanolobus sp. WCC5]|jgi:SAM-dependent methyltransferase|uniref:class I SAM-dependent methyltransferase n=1 Tax=Methanolobus sp. WCC5 TaxID=3125785 RepID=UPI003249C4B9
MEQKGPGIDKSALDSQQHHWECVFSKNACMFGEEPSSPVQWAVRTFKEEGKTKILELGSGQGRDTMYLALNGFEVFALDYCEKGITDLRKRSLQLQASGSITPVMHDVRKKLPFEDRTFDACYSHMLFCMPLTILELRSLLAEIRRVLKPGGLNIYTTRHTKDPQYGTGIHRGEDMWEIQGGFIVHFLSREKVELLAEGYDITDITEFEEGDLPKKLYRVTLRKKD